METVNNTPAKQLGRPVNPNSPRQLKLKEDAEKRAAGLLKRGRPAAEGSTHSLKQAERLAKIAQGIELKRGRPVNEVSARQQRLNDIARRKAEGSFKLGRPKMVKPEPEVENIVIDVPAVKSKSKSKQTVEA